MSEGSMSNQARSLTDALNTFLQYFVKPGQESQRQQYDHLQAVILECAKLGHVLFSHPSDWRFVFGEGFPGQRTRFVVCPGLDKLGDVTVLPYKSPRRCVAPVTVSV